MLQIPPPMRWSDVKASASAGSSRVGGVAQPPMRIGAMRPARAGSGRGSKVVSAIPRGASTSVSITASNGWPSARPTASARRSYVIDA